ncbi:MAG: type II toxin-antitoxin system VapC family toxin [Desulfosalsimonas sp.]|uniref:type II toxin-antitoxin system VapC family toxin n=1 Tax=Desulfosalsimonas sp. TaxID=3073848 RepID=UPI003970914A
MKKKKFILDSYALLAFFQAEQGGEVVRDIFKKAQAGEAVPLLSVINLGEIYYIVSRKLGMETGQAVLEDISKLPVDLIEAGTARVLAAAEIKAQHPLSYADAFAVAAAMEFSATIVTGDPEFKAVESYSSVLWL